MEEFDRRNLKGAADLHSEINKLKRFKGIALFFIVYILAFFYLEQRQADFHIIECAWDAKIPFCEYFIIPYVLWYPFVGLTVLYLGLWNEDDKEFFGLIHTLVLGMGAFLIISLFYPTALNLRPQLNGNSAYENNIFIEMVRILHKVDTPTNVLPSLHVYNTIACQMALCGNKKCRRHPALLWSSTILSLLIILSTVFLKQHSIVDVVAAVVLYPIVVYCFTPAHFRLKLTTPELPNPKKEFKHYKRPPVL